jgi:hypothetical protein
MIWNGIAECAPLIADIRIALKGVAAAKGAIVLPQAQRTSADAQFRSAAEIDFSHE